MKRNKVKLCACFLFSIGLVNGYAQEATTASGGDASGSGGTVAYSVGQVAYSYQSGTNGGINQGVQQPYEIFTVGIEETVLNISLSVFPNPTNDKLTLQIQDFNNEKLTYQLFDVQGKLLESKPISKNQLEINTTNFIAGTYFLNITQESKKIQSFKIIKN